MREKKDLTFAGIDLAASSHRPTGFVVISRRGEVCLQMEVFEDVQIIRRLEEADSLLVGIDAPLSFPRSGSFRLCDREMRKFGVFCFSPFFIRPLTERAIRLSKILSQKGFVCIEVFPRASQNILGIKTEGKKPGIKWRKSLQKGLSEIVQGIPFPEERLYSSHVLDAILCAYTVFCRWKGSYREVGNDEGKITLPC